MTDRTQETRTPSSIDALLIAGPTASGKSALALALASRLGAVVVNADSMQVYRDLAVITARPTEAEERAAPHALYGTVDGATNHSVSRWLADAKATLTHAHDIGAMPILVGGSGLYLKALTQGLSMIPSVPEEVRTHVRVWADGRPPGELHAELARRDPATAARLRPTDPQRLIRALEVNAATGASLASFQADREPATLDIARCAAVFLELDRGELRARIEQRFETMMAAGALDEVRALAARRLDPALPVMRAHGVPPLLRHLAGTCDHETAIAEAKADTRRYIKRQATFARHQLLGFTWCAPGDALDRLLRVAAARNSPRA